MSPAVILHQTLTSNGLTPDSVRQLSAAMSLAFSQNPSLAAFVAWSLFRTLSDAWDDGQAVPTSDVQPYQDLLPELLAWSETEPAFDDPTNANRAVQAFARCLLAPRI